ncbi:disease resistance RPM1-like [Olea europaea subsp. europaea]|uniref:Disease resistance RPM1-like n=1 Tax=Olea europaea subsp. europaea TaxID=158383 RepID=A0A8S0QYJ5_OLEEU|nr:disease resistance RPM1-like [Olea europaea subsp. europaea]
MAECAVTYLLDRLTIIWEQKVRELKGVKEGIENIKDELERMSAFLRVADAMEDTDMELKVWVKQVRDVAYDTEDVLDKFIFFHLTQRRQDSMANVYVCKLFDWILKLRFNNGIASEIESIRYRVRGIAERHQRYRYKFNNTFSQQGLDPVVINSLAYDRRGDALLVEESELVGIESRKKELMGLLVEGGSRLGVISVAGMGGLGKTTLVKKVYDDPAVKRNFQSHAWITVSQLFKIDELLKDTVQQLFDEIKQAVPQGTNTMNINQLKEVIKQFLQERRYVLVFDDVWSIQAWNAVKYALPNNSYGSRVIITTRLTSVASHASAGTVGNVYMLNPLSEEESWTLFCRKTFRLSSCPPYLMEISHKILKRCAGLPLAIMSISGVLATKIERYDDWVMLSNSLGAELEGNDTLESLRLILLLSFNDLPYYLKSCFLYLSIYPEDHLIIKNSLIRQWIMEGFVKPREGRTLEEVAEGYLNELVNRNMILMVRSNDDGSVKHCRIHDFLREMLVLKSRDQSFVMTANEQTRDWIHKLRRLSIHGSCSKTQPPRCGTQLRSLLAFSATDSESMSSMHELLNGSRMLKVLDMSGSPLESFPKPITKLLHLKYLRLRHTKIKSLPRSIRNLRILETLDLKRSLVTELPDEILELQNLRHIIVYHSVEYSYLPFDFKLGFKPPKGMGALTSLHQLAFVDVSPGTGILKELGKMKELRRLCILKLRTDDGMALCSSIENLQNLRTLSITTTAVDEILDLHQMSSPPLSIQRLYLTGRLEKFPHWIQSLRSLVKVFFKWSRLRDNPLKYLQDLPNLVHLEFLMGYVGEELRFKAGKFQRLRLLDLDKLEPLREVIVEDGAMPHLEKLIIQRCNFLESVPTGIENLINIKVLEFFDMPDEFIVKLHGDHHKTAHIPQVYYTYWRDGVWESYPLEDNQVRENFGRPRTAIRTYDQRNSL